MGAAHKVRVRFSPSPTGLLHLGGARTALFNWIYARSQGGVFVLRIEDTDVGRSSQTFTEDILRELLWLGLRWDEGPDPQDFGKERGAHTPYVQSNRISIYRKYLDPLLAAGNAYPCYCTDEELEQKRRVDVLRKRPPRYDGTCRTLSEEERARRVAEGRPVSIRFNMPEREFVFQDLIRGPVRFDGGLIGDFIIFKSNQTPAYNFACAVDDALMEITHVIRGEDHMANTPRQLALQEALGFASPHFAHISLIVGKDRAKLSKRHGATAVSAYREEGFLSEALVNYLALLGWTPEGEEVMTRDELIQHFSLAKMAKSAALFDLDRLTWFNGQHLRLLSDEALAKLIEPYVGRPVSRSWLLLFAEAIRDNLHLLKDVEELAKLFDPMHRVKFLSEKFPPDQAASVLSCLVSELTQSGDLLRENVAGMLEKIVAEHHGEKGKTFKVIRMALTGGASGPELAKTILLLGKELCLQRTQAALQVVKK